MALRKPDFFIVGAPKSGTTSMDLYLDRHPQVRMAPEKETHHFARDFLLPSSPWWDRERYLELFEFEDPAVVRSGESSVYYLLSDVAAREIHGYDPAARILIHLRDPVDLLYSHHSQLVYEGFQDVLEFEDALERGSEPRLEDADQRMHARLGLPRDYFRLVDFPSQIRRYFEVFPREQVHFVLFDDLSRDPAGTFRALLEFLDVDPDVTVPFDVHNPNKEVRSPLLRELLREPPGWISAPSRWIFPLSVRNRIKSRVKRANTRFVKRSPMRPETRRKLAERLAPVVAATADLVGRDLAHWARPEKSA